MSIPGFGLLFKREDNFHFRLLLIAFCLVFVIGEFVFSQETNTNNNISYSEMIEIIDEFAVDITANYVYPDIAEEIVKKIHADIEDGVYADVKTVDSLAGLLHKTVHEISHDRHFEVESLMDRDGPSTNSSPARPDDFGSNHGFRKIEILPGNIGYINLEALPGDDEALEAATREMARVADCDALIFDLRDNEGGSGDMVSLLCNYLFDEGVLLFSFYDRNGQKIFDGITDPDFEGKRFPHDVPVYVLVSEHTISAAEGLAYILKHHGRAAIVGDTTIGMAHPSKSYSAKNKIFYKIPYLRSEHPITHTDWESTGVIPDIVTAPDAALDVALGEAKKTLDMRKEK